MDIKLQYFVLGIVTYQIIKLLAKSINQVIIERKRKKIINIVQAEFPDNTKVTFSAVAASDRRAMDKIVKQLEEQGTLTSEDVEDYRMDPFPREKS